MHGNVWEWCVDSYVDYPSGPVTDPRIDLSGTSRVLRGGGWDSEDLRCRSAFRESGGIGNRYHAIGCRLVLLPGQESPAGKQTANLAKL
jgi:formylglycine-generating enzyme required for sulfatase activity